MTFSKNASVSRMELNTNEIYKCKLYGGPEYKLLKRGRWFKKDLFGDWRLVLDKDMQSEVLLDYRKFLKQRNSFNDFMEGF